MVEVGADTARVTLADGGDMVVYGNNVKNESPGLDWIKDAMTADVGGRGKRMAEGDGGRWTVAESRG